MIISTVFLGVIMANFSLMSPSFQKRGLIPNEYSCAGDDMSPELKWQASPINTKSFAVIAIDPNAPGGNFVHWIIYNIPGSLNHLSSDIEKEAYLSRGILQGTNSFGNVGYGGPCPAQGETHSYVFTLYALDILLPLGPNASYDEIQNAMRGHVLGETRMSGHFTKH